MERHNVKPQINFFTNTNYSDYHMENAVQTCTIQAVYSAIAGHHTQNIRRINLMTMIHKNGKRSHFQVFHEDIFFQNKMSSNSIINLHLISNCMKPLTGTPGGTYRIVTHFGNRKYNQGVQFLLL